MAFWDDVAKKTGTDIKLLNGNTIPASGGGVATGVLAGAQTVGKPSGLAQQSPGGLSADQLAYFDKTYGGIDKYKGIQDERLMGAILSGDKDLEQRLLADNARVGYGINQEPIWARDNVLKGIEAQKLATDQQIANYMMMANQQAGANNQFLQEGIGTINKQKNQNDLRIQETENRFGGVYSGGLRLQQNGNTQRAGESVNNLQRDIASRNANIWQNFGQLASQAQEKIAQLTSSAPEMIREAVLGVRDSNRQFAIQEAGVTGMYNGQLTPDGQAQQLTNQINQLKLDNLPNEIRLNLELLEQDLKSGKINLQTAEYQINEIMNPNSTTNKLRALEVEAASLGNEELRKRIAQIGKAPVVSAHERRIQEIELALAEEELIQAKGGTGGLNGKMLDESRGMIDAIRGGEITPQAALTQIEQDTKLGFYTPQEADILKSMLQEIAPSAPEQQVSEQQQEAIKSIPSDKVIEAEAKKLGYPTLDYRTWYKDPKGKTAGVDFKTWQKLYGPRIVAR